jgi:hypothetical protein
LNHRFTTLKEYGIKNNDVVEVKEELWAFILLIVNLATIINIQF